MILLMKNWLNHNKLYLIGSVIGAIAGYVYWQQVGCVTGTCAITSKPLNSTIFGAMMGSLVFSLFKQQITKKQSRSGRKEV